MGRNRSLGWNDLAWILAAISYAAVLARADSINTNPGGTVTLGTGTTLTDAATLSGGLNPTGTITFTLTNPSSIVVDTETVPVNGNGTYTTPVGFLPLTAGTYEWAAAYSGDPSNSPSSATGELESVVLTSTVPEPGSLTLMCISLAMLVVLARARSSVAHLRVRTINATISTSRSNSI